MTLHWMFGGVCFLHSASEIAFAYASVGTNPVKKGMPFWFREMHLCNSFGTLFALGCCASGRFGNWAYAEETISNSAAADNRIFFIAISSPEYGAILDGAN